MTKAEEMLRAIRKKEEAARRGLEQARHDFIRAETHLAVLENVRATLEYIEEKDMVK